MPTPQHKAHFENAPRAGNFLARAFTRAGLDDAVRFTLLARSWQAIAGVTNLLLIATFFTGEVQGYYYTFASLLALQVFFDLGFYTVIVNLTSREWSALGLDKSGGVVGNAKAIDRLSSLLRFILRWYSALATLLVFGVGLSGYLFLAEARETAVQWQWPWTVAVLLMAAQFWSTPIITFLEGCDRVLELSKFRLVQSLLETVIGWVMILAGLGLWVVPGVLLVKIVTTFYLLAMKNRQFFASLLIRQPRYTIRWRTEIWPMQWRLAVGGVMHYFIFSLFTPVMFHSHGAVIAGQTGMTLQIISVIQSMSLAWVQTKIPTFGMLAASGSYDELDRVWSRAAKQSFAFLLFGSSCVWVTLIALANFLPDLAGRLLEPGPTLMFLAGYALMQISSYQAMYLRAHARDPFVILSLISGILIGSAVFLLGSRHGPAGAAIGLLAANAVVLLPLSTAIWSRCRKDWHARS